MMPNKIFLLRIAIATISLIIMTSSYVTLTQNHILCRGETNPCVKSNTNVIVDVYTVKGGRGIGKEGVLLHHKKKCNSTLLCSVAAP